MNSETVIREAIKLLNLTRQVAPDAFEQILKCEGEKFEKFSSTVIRLVEVQADD